MAAYWKATKENIHVKVPNMEREDRRLDAQIDTVEKRAMDVHASQTKFTMELVEELRKMLQAEVDRKVATTQT